MLFLSLSSISNHHLLGVWFELSGFSSFSYCQLCCPSAGCSWCYVCLNKCVAWLLFFNQNNDQNISWSPVWNLGRISVFGKEMKGVWVFKSPSTKYLSNKLFLEVYRWLTTKYSPEQQRGSKYGITFTLWAIMPSSLYLFPRIANSGSPHCCFAIWPSCQVGSSIFFQSAKTFAPPKNQIAPDYYN